MKLSLGRPALALLLVAWSLLVWWLLTSTTVTRGVRFPGASFLFNLGHAVLFGVQAVLAILLVEPGVVRPPRGRMLAAALVVLAYSGLLEWRQGFVPGRESSWLDMLTNAAGAFGAPWALARPLPVQLRPLRVALAAAGCAVLATLAHA